MTQSSALSRENWDNDAVKGGSSYKKTKKSVRLGEVANISINLHSLENLLALVEWHDDKNHLHRLGQASRHESCSCTIE